MFVNSNGIFRSTNKNSHFKWTLDSSEEHEFVCRVDWHFFIQWKTLWKWCLFSFNPHTHTQSLDTTETELCHFDESSSSSSSMARYTYFHFSDKSVGPLPSLPSFSISRTAHPAYSLLCNYNQITRSRWVVEESWWKYGIKSIFILPKSKA